MAAKDLYEKDLYKILGVSKSDNAAMIKKAYRKLAKDLHPDNILQPVGSDEFRKLSVLIGLDGLRRSSRK
jgi:DnaJ-class molecular chaperone